jgi:hypothetical protein
MACHAALLNPIVSMRPAGLFRQWFSVGLPAFGFPDTSTQSQRLYIGKGDI